MGSNSSKSPNGSSLMNKSNGDTNDLNSDPRSPTPEISRTPLQGKNGTKHNITKNADLRNTFENLKEEKLIHNNPILSAVIKNQLLSYDPRSPTQDFERTPIVIGSKYPDDINKNDYLSFGSPCLANDLDANESCEEVKEDVMVPKNLCNGFFDMTLNESIKETEDSMEPLGSSTASNDAIEKDISHVKDISDINIKPTILLETNFDYVDNSVEDIKDISNEIDTYQFRIASDDPRSPSLEIERTPIVITKDEKDRKENIVEEMSDDSLIKVLQNTNVELRQSVINPVNQDGLLIYEDDSSNINDTPKKTKSTSNNGARTPLSCMKNKTDTTLVRSKSTNNYDPNTQSIANINKKMSHIPRLKSLSKQTHPTPKTFSLKNLSKTSILSGDCENTPPQSHRDIWDKDSSVVL